MGDIEIVKLLVTIFLGGGGVFAVIKFLFPNIGLKKQKKIEINTEQSRQCIEIYKKVIEFEQKANVIESLEIVHPELFNIEQTQFQENHIIYMTIMENRENLNCFWDELSAIKRRDSVWLSNKVAAYLLYAEKYIMDFTCFLKI